MAAIAVRMMSASAAAATALVWACSQVAVVVDHRSIAATPCPVGLRPLTAGHQ
jgi:hypothetical protein